MRQDSFDIRKLLDLAQAQTLAFLSEHLPTAGGEDWWQESVLDKLTMSQQRVIDEQKIDGLDGLDLAALARVLSRNWYELAIRVQLPRNGQTLVRELGDIRNQVAHAPAAGLELEDLQRAADTTSRYLQLLGAGPEHVNQAIAVRDRLRRTMLGGLPGDEQTGKDTAGGESEDSNAASDHSDQDGGGVEDLQGRKVLADQGVPLPWLQPGGKLTEDAQEAFRAATYVGIDFGTSTSVASVVEVDQETAALSSVPISIRQFDRLGRELDQHLVPTCIAWIGERLLVGAGAAELKTELTEGRDLWTSFKMQLGVDLGPQYPGTKLPEKDGPETIERPRDAARVFFSTLRAGIEDYVSHQGKPQRVRYTVTVPASFEANQRKDLLQAIEDAGIPAEDCVLFDEPNAAFLSYLVAMEQKTDGSRFVDNLSDGPKKVLVFDFGAGTCDISILEVRVDQDRLTSRNLGISRFWALGGDDIDRAIAKDVLLRQLCGNDDPYEIFSARELENLILPRLKPVAEELKVSCSKYAEDKGFRTPEELDGDQVPRYANAMASFKVQGKLLQLDRPQITLAEFADVLRGFLGAEPVRRSDESLPSSILDPVESALEKVGLEPSDLDMVLFIGGSSENPLVRHAVSEYVGRFVDCVTPRDLRSHVSQGAAVDSFFAHGLGYTPIKPITSEDIFVVTTDGGQELVLAAGSPVPSADINVTEFVVDQDDQTLIELPFCVSRRDKLLGVVTLEPPPSGTFQKGAKVRVSCKFTADKLLQIRTSVSGTKVTSTSILNPLANEALSAVDRSMLQAQQALNVSILGGRGRPSVDAAIAYAKTAKANAQWQKAAEMFEAVEQLDPNRNYATEISYCYSRARDRKRSSKWSRLAYDRSPGAVTAYNLAIDMSNSGNSTQFARMMEEAFRHDPDFVAALCVYGHHLMNKGDSRGIEWINRAFELLQRDLRQDSLDSSDIWILRRCATTLGRTATLEKLKGYSDNDVVESRPYSEEHLVRGAGDVGHSREV